VSPWGWWQRREAARAGRAAPPDPQPPRALVLRATRSPAAPRLAPAAPCPLPRRNANVTVNMKVTFLWQEGNVSLELTQVRGAA
jgi:hypothetical protein